ncbi:MAG: GIY-YIG nuclease family protein [Eubacteriales bacterium]|nr:GIY-YIG nuclease family protein [Eubacteriales bacterium]
MNIYLNEILNIDKNEYCDWTISLNNANNDQVYSFEENEERLLEHISWKKHSGSNVSFRNINTKYCLQFIRLDKDLKYDQWLFLGAFENCGVNTFEDGHQTYILNKLDRFSNYAERLIVEFKKKQGPKQAKIDISNIETIPVVKILEKKYVYTYKDFPGYDNVSLDFADLKKIIENKVESWYLVLKNANCVYCITDTSCGKIYIGSTYGYDGIWQRWSCYVYTNGTGNNDELVELLKENPNKSKDFKFTILETFFNLDSKDTQFIINREQYWKDVFCSRKFGYNKN